jgi:hypothetical protein
MFITEEDHVEFTKYEQLSYFDKGEENIELYVDNEYLGDMKVWLDSEMDNREYITLNYEIVYLDELKKL